MLVTVHTSMTCNNNFRTHMWIREDFQNISKVLNNFKTTNGVVLTSYNVDTIVDTSQ